MSLNVDMMKYLETKNLEERTNVMISSFIHGLISPLVGAFMAWIAFMIFEFFFPGTTLAVNALITQFVGVNVIDFETLVIALVALKAFLS